MIEGNKLRDGNTIHVNNYCNEECRESIIAYKEMIEAQAKRIEMLDDLIKRKQATIDRGRKLYYYQFEQIQILLREKK